MDESKGDQKNRIGNDFGRKSRDVLRKDNWHLKSVERLGIPEVMVSDGPHGLRKQEDKTDIWA